MNPSSQEILLSSADEHLDAILEVSIFVSQNYALRLESIDPFL